MGRLRIATFNAALARSRSGALIDELAGGSAQAQAVAALIALADPDILLLNEFDHDPADTALALFQRDYLAASCTRGAFAHHFTAPMNTGVPSGHDLDRDGRTDGPGDALGFGRHPGQYGMVLLSRLPVCHQAARTFRTFPWAMLPGAVLPTDDRGEPWYGEAVRSWLPLSSKSHWDVPVITGGRTLHLLASHPTPPAFDGPERRNRLRNRDELRFWQHYLDGHPALRDDAGRCGGAPAEPVVLIGDLNADPCDGDGDHEAIRALLEHPRLADPRPTSCGNARQGRHTPPRGNPALHTAEFGAFTLRIDYVLPDRRLPVRGAGVQWPERGCPGHELIGDDPERPVSSDHRLVWVDVEPPD